MSHKIVSLVAVVVAAGIALALAQGQELPPGEGFTIAVLTDKEVNELPFGPRFWRIENFPTLAEAQAVVGPYGLAAEAGEAVWLFTLGPAGASGAGSVRGSSEQGRYLAVAALLQLACGTPVP
ncbi:MAG TPA: hypothetical protein VKZ43_00050 [Trueperaceae bacterium]|nr:hypothetical protein [Trueperaceae bacterium]